MKKRIENSIKKGERGFSLVEMIVVVVILSFCLLAVTGFVLRLQIAEFAYGQKTGTADRESVVTAQANKDFEKIGRNLASNEPRVKFGKISPEFLPNDDYTVLVNDTQAEISRLGNTGGGPLASLWVLSRGSGELSFEPEAFPAVVGWQNGNGENRVFRLESNTDFTILENDVRVYAASGGVDSNQPGDRLVIALNTTDGGSGLCQVNYYRRRGEERQLIYQSRNDCPRFALQPYADLGAAAKLHRLEIKGSWFESNDPGDQERLLPLLPYKGEERLSNPVWISASGEEFTLFVSNLTTDSVTLKSPVSFPDREADLTVNNPLRGEFKIGDYCLLIDYRGRKSVLGKITEAGFIRDGSQLKFVAANRDNPAWEQFRSADEDYIGHEFPTTAKLVRLDPAITYQKHLDSTGAGAVLLRREGVDAWENVAYGLYNFSISKPSERNRNLYFLNFSLSSEDDERSEPREVKLTLEPDTLEKR